MTAPGERQMLRALIAWIGVVIAAVAGVSYLIAQLAGA